MKKNAQHPIVISLEDSRDACRQDSSSLLQKEGIEKIKHIIQERLQEAQSYRPQTVFTRKHNTVTVLGERGTGKTTFLLSLEKAIENEELHSKVVFLDVIDPTLYEKKENILISLCAAIIEKVDGKTQEKDASWQESLQNLARGFSLMDKVGENPMQEAVWDDLDLLMGIGIQNARAGLNFEKNFHLFIHESLKHIDGGKSLFVIRLDDIDTNFDRGWEVLETIRKYLTSPEILVVVAGDWELYYELVKKHQLDVLKYDNKEPINIEPIVEQYLTKILKPEYRFFMQTVKSILEKRQEILVKDAKKSSVEKPIWEWFEKIARELLHRDDKTAIAIFMSLPIRLVIQVLHSYVKHSKTSDLSAFHQEINLIFMTYLLANRFTIADLDTLTTHTGLTGYANKIIQETEKSHHQLTNLIRLEYQYFDKELNMLYLLLKSNIVNAMQQSPAKYFEWFFRVKILEHSLPSNLDKEVIRPILQYFRYDRYLTIFDASRLAAGFFEKKDPERNLYGSTYLHQNRIKDDKETFAWDRLRRYAKEALPSDSRETLFALVRIAGHILVRKNLSEKRLDFGVLNILGFIGSFLRGEIQRVPLLQITAYDASVEKFFLVESSEGATNDLENTELLKKLDQWKRDFLKKVKMPPLEWANRFWSELIEKLESGAQGDVRNIGEFLDLQIHIFLNTLLRNTTESQETYRIMISERSRLKTNMGKAEYAYLFESNAYEKAVEKESVTLFEMMYLCPLWSYYSTLNGAEARKTKTQNMMEQEIAYCEILGKMPIHKNPSKQKNKTDTFEDDARQCIEENIAAITNIEDNDERYKIVKNCLKEKAKSQGKDLRISPQREEKIKKLLSEIEPGKL